VVGVTGTNGKTSCSQWIAQALTRTGRKCAVVGTLGSGFPGALDATSHTTPDAVCLHEMLDVFVQRGARALSMEVSSHGLAQHRVSGVEFDVALFTNLSRDHLDYHGTMRSYRAAKAKLFRWPTLRYAVLNLDDEFGVELATRAWRAGVAVVGYGFTRARVPGARGHRVFSVQGRNLRVGRDGVAFDVVTSWGSTAIVSRLIGRFNAANLLGTLATLLASGMGLEEAARVLRRVEAPPGRTESYGGGSQPLVVVDYAHTPDALEKVLAALRELLARSKFEPRGLRPRAGRPGRGCANPDPKLICVFGCGGERDRGKRPMMGAVAARLADHTIVTSDNPRGEDPETIIDDIARGLDGAPATLEPDRARAIRLAIGMARPGDIVLVAGKGHERYQEINGVRYPFSDGDAVRAALRAARS
jgi:UDP-N-acetylmuramoyl-L-alanyl-D-glutamate--2,6-diaminopimelate ligase